MYALSSCVGCNTIKHFLTSELYGTQSIEYV